MISKILYSDSVNQACDEPLSPSEGLTIHLLACFNIVTLMLSTTCHAVTDNYPLDCIQTLSTTVTVHTDPLTTTVPEMFYFFIFPFIHHSQFCIHHSPTAHVFKVFIIHFLCAHHLFSTNSLCSFCFFTVIQNWDQSF